MLALLRATPRTAVSRWLGWGSAVWEGFMHASAGWGKQQGGERC